MSTRISVCAGACLLLLSIVVEGLADEMTRPDEEEVLDYQVGDELDTVPDLSDYQFFDVETGRPVDSLLDRLIKNEIRDYLSFDVYRNQWELPWPVLQQLPSKRGPLLFSSNAKTASKNKNKGQKDQRRTSYKQPRWKTKKGRKGSGPMLCYFKLCAFRRPT